MLHAYRLQEKKPNIRWMCLPITMWFCCCRCCHSVSVCAILYEYLSGRFFFLRLKRLFGELCIETIVHHTNTCNVATRPRWKWHQIQSIKLSKHCLSFEKCAYSIGKTHLNCYIKSVLSEFRRKIYSILKCSRDIWYGKCESCVHWKMNHFHVRPTIY